MDFKFKKKIITILAFIHLGHSNIDTLAHAKPVRMSKLLKRDDQ